MRCACLHLDTNALIALADPLGETVIQVRKRVQEGVLPEASAVAWHEFVRGPLLPDELLRIERVVGARIRPITRSTAELAARLRSENCPIRFLFRFMVS